MSTIACLYTHQKTKKRKTWQDGTLKWTRRGSCTLFDSSKRHKESRLLDADEMVLLDSGQGCELEWDGHLITVEAMEMTAFLPDAVDNQNVNETGMGAKKGTKRTILAPFKAPKQIEKPLHVPLPEADSHPVQCGDNNRATNVYTTVHNGNHSNTGTNTSATSVDASLLSKLVSKVSTTAQADYRNRYATDTKFNEPSSTSNNVCNNGKRYKMDPAAIDAELDDLWADEAEKEEQGEYDTGRNQDPLQEDLVAAQASQESQYSEQGREMYDPMNDENDGIYTRNGIIGYSNATSASVREASKPIYAPETQEPLAVTTTDEDDWGF